MSHQLVSSPIHVLITSRSFSHYGGVVNYTKLLLKHSDKERVRFTHVIIGKYSPHSPGWLRPFEYFGSVWRFVRALLRTHPDIIQLNPSLNWRSLPLNLLLLTIAKMLCGRPVLIYFRGWLDEVADSILRSTWYGSLLKWLLGHASAYVVLASNFQKQLLQAGFAAEKVFVSPVMVNTELFQIRKNRCRPSSVEASSFNVLFLARLSQDKGIWHFVKAIEWIHHEHPEVSISFTIAGTGPEAERLQVYLKEYLRDRIVQMPGYVQGSEKGRLYKKADLFVFPSYYEGFPNVIVEALAAGLPIIYTPVGALTEVLQPANGLRIELSQLSGETLGRKILELYCDPVQRRNMGTVNRQVARDYYDVKVVCERMGEIYRHVAESA